MKSSIFVRQERVRWLPDETVTLWGRPKDVAVLCSALRNKESNRFKGDAAKSAAPQEDCKTISAFGDVLGPEATHPHRGQNRLELLSRQPKASSESQMDRAPESRIGVIPEVAD